MKQVLKTLLTTTPAGRVLMLAPRLRRGWQAAGLGHQLGTLGAWWFASRETGNWTYRTSEDNQIALCFLVATLTGTPMPAVRHFLDELFADRELHARVAQVQSAPGLRWQTDDEFKPGRRLAYYLLARCMKPRHVVEAGLDKGLGGLLLSRALLRNAQEGHPGRYTGIEYDPHRATPYLARPFHDACAVVRGDSVAWLRDFGNSGQEPIDLFIHDTTPSEPHLGDQLRAVLPRMRPNGVLLSVWTTRALFDFAAAHGLTVLTHKDDTVAHPHPGARLSFVAFGPAATSP